MLQRQARHRERDLRVGVAGTYSDDYSNFSDTRVVGVGETEVCDDFINGWYTDNPFAVQRNIVHYPRLNGERRIGGIVYDRFDSYPIDYRPGPRTDFPASWLNPDLFSIAQTLAAKTNPSRELVSLVQNIGELRDTFQTFEGLVDVMEGATGVVQNRGLRRIAAAAKAAAAGHISWRFGISPTVGDLRKLIRFKELADAKAHYLKRLRDRPLSARVEFEADSVENFVPDQLVHSFNTTIRADIRTVYTLKHWGTVRWAPSLGDVWPGTDWDTDTFNEHVEAFNLSLGTNSHGAITAAWELIPFSWLHDWFMDFGQWLRANNREFPVSPDHMNYMMTMTSKTTYENIVHDDWVGLSGDYSEVQVRKYRVPLDITLLLFPPLAALGVLDPEQLLILGSLMILGSL